MKRSYYVDKFARTTNPRQDFPQEVSIHGVKSLSKVTKTEKIFVLLTAFLRQLPGCKNHI